jgi:hypothetical protein
VTAMLRVEGGAETVIVHLPDVLPDGGRRSRARRRGSGGSG